MAPVLILPGIGNSGPQHWQSLWQSAEPTYVRVQVPDWEQPEVEAWVSALDAAVRATVPTPIVVAHSLGCLTVAHWVARGGRARAALLVAVPDPAGPAFPAVARSFAPFPLEPFGFPTRLVASRNDPYGSFEFAGRCAAAWGSEMVDAGFAGHINAESGLGAWSAGRALLADWLAHDAEAVACEQSLTVG